MTLQILWNDAQGLTPTHPSIYWVVYSLSSWQGLIIALEDIVTQLGRATLDKVRMLRKHLSNMRKVLQDRVLVWTRKETPRLLPSSLAKVCWQGVFWESSGVSLFWKWPGYWLPTTPSVLVLQDDKSHFLEGNWGPGFWERKRYMPPPHANSALAGCHSSSSARIICWHIQTITINYFIHSWMMR